MSAPDPQDWRRARLWDIQAVRDLLVLATLIGVVWTGAQLSLVTVPLLLGLGLAYVVEPLITWLAARPRMDRTRAVVAVACGLALAVLLALAIAVPPLVRQGITLAKKADGYAERSARWLVAEERPAWLRERTEPLLAPWLSVSASAPVTAVSPVVMTDDEQRIRNIVRDELARAAPSTDTGMGGIAGALSGAWSAFSAAFNGAVSLLIGAGIAGFCAVVFALNWPRVVSTLDGLVPAANRTRVRSLATRMDAVVAAFVRGRLIVAALVGVLYALGWSLVGVPYGLVLGLAVGALSVVPYLAAVGLPLAWILLAVDLSQGDGTGSWYVGADGVVWWLVLVLPLVVNVVVQTVEDYVLNPLIQGKATELHPVVIMIAVIAGGQIAGLYGMLLAVPVAACLRILWSEVLLPRWQAWGTDSCR